MADAYWVTPPSTVSQGIRQYGEQIQGRALAAAQALARQVETEMKAEAPWTDQSGQARAQLYAEAQALTTEVIELLIGGRAPHQVFLEVCNGGRYAIVGPTFQRVGPRLLQMLADLGN